MAEPSPLPLFRPEAMAEQRDRWLGSVLLVPRLSYSVLTLFAAIIVIGILALIAFGEYTRKVRLSGWLTPQQGLLQVAASQPGLLAQLPVQEGQQVERGDVLAVLSSERRSGAGESRQEVLRALRARRDSLAAERDSHRALYARQSESHQARLAVIEAEAASLDAEFAMQRDRVDLADASAARLRDLRDRGLATQDDLQRAEESAFDQALSLQALERTRATVNRTRVELTAEIAEHPLREGLQLAEIDRAIAQIEQELAEAEAARETVLTAPRSGTVTALRATAGETVDSATPLMTLIPSDTILQAQIYGPSRDIGFVEPGQRVLIRYDAYPHQKFGQYDAKVRSVSRATVGPGELAEAAGATGPLADLGASGQPVYRITVDLDAQSATAYGRDAPLQPGMTLQADIQIETRRLWQWILEPLHSLRGREPA
ncbi:HlyD family efflux transporter periplasmic adaptor subunit [Paracoccus sp. R12_1]|uniref:HlyD family secretion protein n=1 Tax=unclassified Paracoccus (in: a-proteobacteria) TaxID=2688777 RepID=UPI001ADAA8DD|nr:MULTISPECIES: HlyD family efflux transporter periplasmic adaptor subunit [unclassified Paracoccus (in: a-proteobacteria)]MBO9455871.1 HlyD family efflux transporter periplasmic adaptor subunit [Paracoccus sp. R12_2]MBO9488441.1 HlyD family efflux transporter periplasmic adaptor subunit [Paracoccus sp. R12_1]